MDDKDALYVADVMSFLKASNESFRKIDEKLILATAYFDRMTSSFQSLSKAIEHVKHTEAMCRRCRMGKVR